MSFESVGMPMDIDRMFGNIDKSIREGRMNEVGPMVDLIISSDPDPMIMIKCASLLKVIEDEEGCDDVLDMVVDSVSDDNRFAIAQALRGLNRNEDALDILSEMKENDSVLREKSKASLALGDPDASIALIGRIISQRPEDKITHTEALCAKGKYDDAYVIAEKLAKDENNSYASLVNLCGTMIRMGRNKDAMRTAKAHYKEDKKNADVLALGAYVMRINGRMPAAANLAHSALKIDIGHIGAMETLALCYVEKKKFIEAKFIAGAINEKDPGNPAAIRILDACRAASH